MKAMDEVIGELTEGIRVRQDAITALRRVSGLGLPMPGPVPEVAAVRNGNGRPARSAKPAPGKRWSRGRSAPFDACRKLEEPFTAKDMAKATGITEKGASSQVYRWLGQGLLLKVSPGVWKRSSKFPPADNAPLAAAFSPPSGEPATPALKDGRVAELERAIKDACRERDKEREKGRDRLAQVYQDRIDKLQKELEAVEG